MQLLTLIVINLGKPLKLLVLIIAIIDVNHCNRWYSIGVVGSEKWQLNNFYNLSYKKSKTKFQKKKKFWNYLVDKEKERDYSSKIITDFEGSEDISIKGIFVILVS